MTQLRCPSAAMCGLLHGLSPSKDATLCQAASLSHRRFACVVGGTFSVKVHTYSGATSSHSLRPTTVSHSDALSMLRSVFRSHAVGTCGRYRHRSIDNTAPGRWRAVSKDAPMPTSRPVSWKWYSRHVPRWVSVSVCSHGRRITQASGSGIPGGAAQRGLQRTGSGSLEHADAARMVRRGGTSTSS